MITLELLQTFCYKGDWRPTIATPWTRGEFTYASNGVVLVRVPAMAEVTREDGPQTEVGNLQWQMLGGCLFLRLPPAHTYTTEVECECDCCGHKHKRDDYICVDVGNRRADGLYLAQLDKLPGIEIDHRQVLNEDWPFGFRFDGGDGLLMPMRKP